MKRRHAHLLRAAVLAVAATAGWYCLTAPASLLTASWAALGWALIAAELGAWLAARAVTFFAGPAWWCALVTAGQRKAWRHRQAERGKGRPHIPDRIRRWVLRADGHACVYCGQRDQLQMEHIWSWSWGGLTSLHNLITLCGPCNRLKSNFIRLHGRAYYRGFGDCDDIEGAALIYDHCRAVRRSPARLCRLMVACLAG
jgi:hypothetical protein